MGLMCNRQTEVRRQKTTLEKMNEFFFDQPADEETGIPATQGWTTKVDTALRLLVHGQARGNLAIGEVVREVKPDSNGGENLRGVLERTAEATGVKITKQTEERERVQLRDAVRDTQS